MAAPSDNDTPTDIEFQKQANLSPAETVSQAKKIQQTIVADFVQVQKWRDEATKAKDIIKLNCLNDAVAQISALVDLTNKSLGTLTDAVGRNDDATRQQEFTRITLLGGKVQTLRDQAASCKGEDINFVSNAGATLEIDPTIPTTDPTDTGLPTFDVVPRPTEASPTS